MWTYSYTISCVFCRPLSQALAIALSRTAACAKSRLLCARGDSKGSEKTSACERVSSTSPVCPEGSAKQTKARRWQEEDAEEAPPRSGQSRQPYWSPLQGLQHKNSTLSGTGDLFWWSWITHFIISNYYQLSPNLPILQIKKKIIIIMRTTWQERKVNFIPEPHQKNSTTTGVNKIHRNHYSYIYPETFQWSNNEVKKNKQTKNVHVP